MTTLTERLEEYLVVRRSLGYDLSFTARVLRVFTAFADRESADHITVDLFLRWKQCFGNPPRRFWRASTSGKREGLRRAHVPHCALLPFRPLRRMARHAQA